MQNSHSRGVVLIGMLVSILTLLLNIGTASAQGILLPGPPDARQMELREHLVEFSIEERAAVTKVSHTFYNPNNQQMEATFYFPIPEGAVTTDFALWMNGRRVEGEVLPREQARRIYQQIVSRVRDPGLLEYVNGTLFQARIFPVPARGEQKVEIEYATVLERSGDTVRYHYPVHATGEGVAQTFLMNGKVRSSGNIQRIYSPHHRFDERRVNARERELTAEAEDLKLANDVEIFITSNRDDLAFSLLTWGGDRDEDGYFMMTISPSDELEELSELPREIVFVVDTSGSMDGEKMEQARELLEWCVNELNARDRFNIVSFASSAEGLFEGPVPASTSNRQRALQFIRNLEAAGGTNIGEAMGTALQGDVSSRHASSVFFITDGKPSVGERSIFNLVDLVEKGVEDDPRRVFAFGVGYDVNTRLLNGMADVGRGRAGYVRPGEDLRAAIGGFYQRVAAPLLTEVEIDYGTSSVFRTYPRRPETLYRGEDLVIFGRFEEGADTRVRLSGRAGGNAWSDTFRADFGDDEFGGERSFIGSLWAGRRIADLLAEIEREGESDETVDQVRSLAIRWNIVTPYTSYLAVDPSETVPPPRPPRPPCVGFRCRPVPMRDGEGRGTASSAPSGGGSSFGGGSRSRAQAQDMSADEAMVEQSIARREMEEADRVSGNTERGAAETRVVAGRTFRLRSGEWIEDNLPRATRRTVQFGSDEYFALAADSETVASILALGPRITFELDGVVIQVR